MDGWMDRSMWINLFYTSLLTSTYCTCIISSTTNRSRAAVIHRLQPFTYMHVQMFRCSVLFVLPTLHIPYLLYTTSTSVTVCIIEL